MAVHFAQDATTSIDSNCWTPRHFIASIHSSCSQGRMRISAPTGHRQRDRCLLRRTPVRDENVILLAELGRRASIPPRYDRCRTGVTDSGILRIRSQIVGRRFQHL